jgi:hypothetical protein
MNDKLCVTWENIYKKESLKIPKGKSESVSRRSTDNTMAKRKKYKRTNNDVQNITHKTKDQCDEMSFFKNSRVLN